MASGYDPNEKELLPRSAASFFSFPARIGHRLHSLHTTAFRLCPGKVGKQAPRSSRAPG
ncbi:hypothetical protein PHLCEN_2v54 [Hermanssonia centrifuga]|uniref:Uncharacterized protein n=1 Tax=Hermanssonia centrifuga TaxID=98765 RepID=A0A2R6S702_9APHY|nr:hypothetical protein PHLCEN_2v54 [Hermanssonia centrifuga]